MQTRTRGIAHVGAVLLLAGSLAACMDKQNAPGLIGPSGSAQQLSLSASPDRIAHNGSAQSVITVALNNDTGQPIANQRLSLGASTGTLSHGEVVTGADGRASFIVTAPALSIPAQEINVFATPVGTDANGAMTRQVAIALTGTLNATSPSAAFTFLPESPVAPDAIVFDASTTLDEGQACLDRCTYQWNFRGLGAGSTDGLVVTRDTVAQGTYAVTLTVTDNAGTVSSTTQVVVVAAPAAVTP